MSRGSGPAGISWRSTGTELGNIWGECGLSTDALANLVAAYDGRALRNKIARAMLLGIAGKCGWTLWGAIQAATSPIEFDCPPGSAAAGASSSPAPRSA